MRIGIALVLMLTLAPPVLNGETTDLGSLSAPEPVFCADCAEEAVALASAEAAYQAAASQLNDALYAYYLNPTPQNAAALAAAEAAYNAAVDALADAEYEFDDCFSSTTSILE